MELEEALYTTRAMRRVKPDPVPDEVVTAMLDAAIRAPTGSGGENWRWITVTDRSTMAVLAEMYREAYHLLNTTMYAGKKEQAEARDDQRTLRVMSSSEWLAENFEQVPLVVMAFHRNDPSGASIYPAVWSLMLEARSHGVGATLTTVLSWFKNDEVCALLDVPTDKGWTNAAAITCGYPLGRWGLATRKPPQDVTFSERWGQSPSWAVDEPLWNEY